MDLAQVFDQVERQVAEQSRVHDLLREKREAVEEHTKKCQRQLALLHTECPEDYSRVTTNDKSFSLELKTMIAAVQDLAGAAADYPFYKYSYMWDNCMQNCIYVVLLSACMSEPLFQLLTPAEVASKLGIAFESPVESDGTQNDKDKTKKRKRQDSSSPKFFFTTEQYLQAVISLANELSRLAVNAVTHASTANYDIDRCLAVPTAIDKFLKELTAAFMTLNLKNDSLRRRFDSLKYDVKKVEDVVYSLSLRKFSKP